MSVLVPKKTECGEKRSGQSGQALIEYAISAIVMATLVFGVIDFSRAIYEQQVITILTGRRFVGCRHRGDQRVVQPEPGQQRLRNRHRSI